MEQKKGGQCRVVSESDDRWFYIRRLQRLCLEYSGVINPLPEKSLKAIGTV